MRLLNEEGRFRQFSNRDSGLKNHSLIPILDEKEKEAIANQINLNEFSLMHGLGFKTGLKKLFL